MIFVYYFFLAYYASVLHLHSSYFSHFAYTVFFLFDSEPVLLLALFVHLVNWSMKS